MTATTRIGERLIAGVDEAGRGPLAGPVIAAAVILDPNRDIPGVMDSKKLSHRKRIELYEVINRHAVTVGIGRAEVDEIDSINILQATFLAMQRAIESLKMAPEHALIDGNFCPQLPCTTQAVVRGDSSILAISAASIIAKVFRDNEMLELDKKYPEYKFAQNKGYPTPSHIEALREYGVSPVHRRSFKPVARYL